MPKRHSPTELPAIVEITHIPYDKMPPSVASHQGGIFPMDELLPALRTRSGVRLFLHADVLALAEKKRAPTTEAAYAHTA